MDFYFDGYCPESLLKDLHIEMRLNEDDFWESEKTGLQIAVSPPYATILRWRGKGKFRKSSDVASNSLTGLVLAEAHKEDGQEIFPDEKAIIKSKIDLQFYLDQVYDTREMLEAEKFDINDPKLKEQDQYLKSMPKDKLFMLIDSFGSMQKETDQVNVMHSESFDMFHKMLYDLKLIFDFNWMQWDKGWKNINNKNFDYSECSLLDLSMYLTAIFRADRFNVGTIETHFKDGTLRKILTALKLSVSH